MELLQTLRRLPINTLASVQFLSRLPIWRLVKLDSRPNFQETADTFPLAGTVIGLLAWVAVLPVAMLNIAPEVKALVFIAGLMLITGALHEDGLADVADGFWGGHSRARKLEIMRDSAIGTYGTLALFVATGLRWALWLNLLDGLSGLQLGLMIATICGVSRGAMLVPWIFLKAARPATAPASEGKDESGLSIRYGAPNHATGLRALLYCVALLLAVYVSGFSVLPMILGGFCAVAVMCLIARHHIGGHTGDVLGATQQLAELGLLFGCAVAM